MYITDAGTIGIHRIAYEIIDNSIDEYLAGFCSKIIVMVDTKKRLCSVSDNGRGIPIDIHPQTGKPTVESVLTELHMGGKFGKQAYVLSGGLHGIGGKATCALSSKLTVLVKRDGKKHKTTFSRGKVIAKTRQIGSVPKGETGTRIIFKPDKLIFGEHRFEGKEFINRLSSVACLCKGLKLLLYVNGKKYDLTSKKGLAGLLENGLAEAEKSVFDKPLSFSSNFGDSEDESIDVALWWTDGDGEKWYSYVNMIPVPEGGTHVTGARKAIARALSAYCKEKGVVGEDFREGLRVACHVKLKEPQFEGQTKDKLNNPECRSLADRVFSAALSDFLAKNQEVAKALVQRAVNMAKAKAAYRASRKLATQTAYGDKFTRRDLPIELTVALKCTADERELFIVEGKSARGSAVQGRDAYYQEVLPIDGKPPNAVKQTALPKVAAVLENKRIASIIRSIGSGYDIDTPGEACEPTKSRVGKVIIAADADADGEHISCLLLGFFLRHMLPMIEAKMVYIALPPLFVAKWGKGRAFGDTMEEVTDAARKAGVKHPLVSRLKGLGEMKADQLEETIMNPKTRKILQIRADRDSLDYAMRLLGEESDLRKSILGLT